MPPLILISTIPESLHSDISRVFFGVYGNRVRRDNQGFHLPDKPDDVFHMIVVISAFRYGLYLAIFTAIICASVFDFFLVPPYYSFRFSDTQYIITFLGMFLVGGVISLLLSKAREHAVSA